VADSTSLIVAKLSLAVQRTEGRGEEESTIEAPGHSLSISVHVESASHGSVQIRESHEHVVATRPDMQTVGHETSAGREEHLLVGVGSSSAEEGSEK
jgi:hypothetical protein